MNKQRTFYWWSFLQFLVLIYVFIFVLFDFRDLSPRPPAPAHDHRIEQQGSAGMDELRRERSAFLDARERRRREAGQLAAFQLACHLDLETALAADSACRARTALRLERMIERERLRGARSHWSYDLNRHIALKQALDRLRSVEAGEKSTISRQK